MDLHKLYTSNREESFSDSSSIASPPLYMPDDRREEGAIKGVRKNMSKKQLQKGRPKKAMSAYTLFLRETLRNRPEGTPAVIDKDMADRWRNLTADEKTKYDQQAALEQLRYRLEMKEIQEQQHIQSRPNSVPRSMPNSPPPLFDSSPPSKNDDISMFRLLAHAATSASQHQQQQQQPTLPRPVSGVLSPKADMVRIAQPIPTRPAEVFNPFATVPLSPPLTPSSREFPIKVRLAGDTYFREIGVRRFTYEELKHEIFRKFSLQSLAAIVKLPDVLVADDEDVQRLNPLSELQVFP
eukprot:GILK01005238.1.p1 GENE.GILK01005238.1~~GILK01005238.1.p1  ORF type:complete len:296 (+),score=62.12 GILK01005238.1:82-969(+)